MYQPRDHRHRSACTSIQAKTPKVGQMSQGQSQAVAKPHEGKTSRKDNWWVEPALVATGFTLFIVYATWRAFANEFYEVNQYLSPFYSPKIALDFWQWSPAILILWIPAGFRATCYYYRKAYYRAYFWTPPACAVEPGMAGKGYTGETKFPFVFQNAHRYFFYLAVLVLAILWWDAINAFFAPEGILAESKQFTVSVLALVMTANCVFLSGYTFGCHAWRHLCGGSLDCFSCDSNSQARYGIWQRVTKLNVHHMLWAWLSLFSVGFTDFYIMMVARNIWSPIVLF